MTVDGALAHNAGLDSSRSVLRRALSIIDAFSNDDDSVTLTDLARRTDLPKATVYRLVNELVRWGALERSGHNYTLGARLFVLGEMVPGHARLRDLAMPYLSDLYEATHENVCLGVLHGTDVLFLLRLNGHRSSQMKLRAGTALPAHTTASGKVLLAHGHAEQVRDVLDTGLSRMTAHTIIMPGILTRQLRSIAERGYAINTGETRPGVLAVAAPVFGADGTALAAMSVAGRAERINTTHVVPALTNAADAVSRLLRSRSINSEVRAAQ